MAYHYNIPHLLPNSCITNNVPTGQVGLEEKRRQPWQLQSFTKIHPAQPDTPANAGKENPRFQVDKADNSIHTNSESDTPNKVESTGNDTEKCLSNRGTSYRNCFPF